jgi:hypothetical protein
MGCTKEDGTADIGKLQIWWNNRGIAYSAGLEHQICKYVNTDTRYLNAMPQCRGWAHARKTGRTWADGKVDNFLN